MARVSNFTDLQKARIFVRDRAHCCYTARPLWLLDQGCSAVWSIDWADHVKPVAEGGRSDLSNGCCASAHANYDKRDGRGIPPALRAGIPTRHWGRLDAETRQQATKTIRRYSRLHVSDWYFNRAVFRALLGVGRAYGVETRQPRKTRGVEYYAIACLKALRLWRELAAGVDSFEMRGLAPAKPTSDQAILLSLRQARDIADVRRVISALVPYHRECTEMVNRLRSSPSPARAALIASHALTRTWPPGMAVYLARRAGSR